MKKKRKIVNSLAVTFPAKSVNESVARGMIAAFCAPLDPTLEELCDIKTAVSEAVTNCIVHAYRNETDEKKKVIILKASADGDKRVTVWIKDRGCGIEDIEQAMTPQFTGTVGEERSGMGFSIMQCFCDEIRVRCGKKGGTTVMLRKYIGNVEG